MGICNDYVMIMIKIVIIVIIVNNPGENEVKKQASYMP